MFVFLNFKKSMKHFINDAYLNKNEMSNPKWLMCTLI